MDTPFLPAQFLRFTSEQMLLRQVQGQLRPPRLANEVVVRLGRNPESWHFGLGVKGLPRQ